jgi:hypothetical protein
MTTWYVHRRDDNSIASAHGEPQPGYAEEALEDSDPEMAAYLGRTMADPAASQKNTDALVERRARAAERRGDDLTAIKLRMGVR